MFEMTPFERRHHGMSSMNPFRELEEMERDFFRSPGLAEFKTDIHDSGDAYVLEADLPGFKKDDIHLDIEDHYLKISAERHTRSEEKDDKGCLLRSERSYGSFSRRFDISGVKEDAIKAAYKDGVLTLTMPKKEPAQPSARRLDIE